MTAALLDPDSIDRLRSALREYTVDGVGATLGLVGQSALERGDLAGVARALPARDRIATLARLFLLGQEVDIAEARRALAPLDLDRAGALVAQHGSTVRSRVDVRPHASDERPDDWWVVSDFGSDVRPGPVAEDHVLGIGAASLTLAQAALHAPVGRALDVGTGCGVQALHLSGHADSIVATDVSSRALLLAATTAALSGTAWDLREGSLLEPVAGERFDQVVANPPFVVSPGLRRGAGGYDYRDSGLAGDGVTESLLRGLPGVLAAGGTASLLANWIVPSDGDWAGRVAGWLDGAGCDAWVWQREVLDPASYVSLWLRDAGEQPGTARWTERYDAWADWFAAAGIAAVGMGLVTLWQTDGAPQVVCEDVPQAVEQPAGAYLPGWVARRRWLATHDDAQLLGARLRCADGVVRVRHDLLGAEGWQTELAQLRQSYGARWELEVDDAVARTVAACTGAAPLSVPVEMLAALADEAAEDVATALLPVVRDLIGRGFLEPVDLR